MEGREISNSAVGAQPARLFAELARYLEAWRTSLHYLHMTRTVGLIQVELNDTQKRSEGYSG